MIQSYFNFPDHISLARAPSAYKRDYIPTSSMGPKPPSKYSDELRKAFLDVQLPSINTAFEWKGYLEGEITARYQAPRHKSILGKHYS